jgi:hypothetical protein
MKQGGDDLDKLIGMYPPRREVITLILTFPFEEEDEEEDD